MPAASDGGGDLRIGDIAERDIGRPVGAEAPVGAQIEHEGRAQPAGVEIIVIARTFPAQIGRQAHRIDGPPHGAARDRRQRRLGRALAVELRRDAAGMHARIGQRHRRAQGQAIGKRFGEIAFEAPGVDIAGVLPLALGTARDRGTDRHIGDGVMQAVPEHRRVPGEPAAHAAPAGLDAVEFFRRQRGIGVGHVIADAKGTVEFVEARRTEAGISGHAQILASVEIAPHAQPPGRHDAVAAGGIIRRQQRARRDLGLHQMALRGRPFVAAHTRGQQPGAGVIGHLAIEAADDHAPARAAVVLEHATQIEIVLARLAGIVAQIGADLPTEGAILADRRRVEAPAQRRRAILVC